MLLRFSTASAICSLLALLIIHMADRAPQSVQRASDLLGQRWYELILNEQQVGYLVTRAWRDHAGRWHFDSELRFVLNPGQPVVVTDSLTFAARSPHRLVAASHSNQRRHSEDTVRIVPDGDGYHATIMRQASRNASQPDAGDVKQLTWKYGLDDYLAFESWLEETRPAAGAVKTVPTLDFTRLAIVAKKYRVVARDATGYQVENPAPVDATLIQLDHNYAPVALHMSGLFQLKRSTRDRALAPRTALQSASYFIPTDRPLPDHTRIERMVLGVNTSFDAQDLWSDAERHPDGWSLTLHANPVSGTRDGRSELEETLGFPISSSRIHELAREAVGNAASDTEKVAALAGFVHGFLSYSPGAEPQPVLALLDDPVGDCTEFADLFTTLARSVGIPSRTVFGLAYSERQGPAFAFHAWNEVSVDGNWQAVDPTWNQLRVDATHIPLPSNQAAALHLLTGAVDLQFSVQEVAYFSDS